MKNPAEIDRSVIKKALEEKLPDGMASLDILNLVPISPSTDRSVKIKSIEEALREFDQSREPGSQSYVVWVKPRRRDKSQEISKPLEEVYEEDGKVNYRFLIRNARLLMAEKEFDLARNIFQTLLQSGERMAETLYYYGVCHDLEGKLEEAQRNFEESIAYQPSLKAFESLAALLIREKKDRYAAEVIERALKLKDLPDHLRFDFHKACGNCWMRLEEVEAAESHYKKAIEIDPSSDEIHICLGSLYMQANRMTDAIKAYKNAVSCNADSEKAYIGLGCCSYAIGRVQAAHSCFAMALKIDLNNSTAVFYLLKTAYELKKYDVAEKLVSQYVKIAPVNANLLYSLAGLQFHLKKFAEAQITVRKVIDIKPDHHGAQELRKRLSQQES